MKNKLLAGALALLVLLGCATMALAGTQSDPLISVNYLTETYSSGLKTTVTQWVAAATQGIYDDALSKVGQGTPSADGWLTSSGFVQGWGRYADTITLASGAGLIWTDGSGAVSSGVLVDATAGVELAPGKAMTPGHRYIAIIDTVVVASSQSVQWMAEGKWRCGTGGTVVTPLPFTDVSPDQWYYDDVRFVVDNGLFQGISATKFNPTGTMERGMMTTVLYRLAGEPAISYSPVFPDVPDGLWYTKGTVWCAQMKIVNGMGSGLFEPGGTVTRQQIAVMLYNYAIKTGQIADERGNLNVFSDAGSVASWARDAMSWAVGAGILNGSGGKLLPEDGAQRAQVAAMLHRFQDWLDAQ